MDEWFQLCRSLTRFNEFHKTKAVEMFGFSDRLQTQPTNALSGNL